MKSLLPKAIKTTEALREATNEAARLHHDHELLEASEQKEVDITRNVYGAERAKLKKAFEAIVDRLESWAKRNRDKFNGQSFRIDGHALKFFENPGRLANDKKGPALVKDILSTGDAAFIEQVLHLKPTEDKATIKAILQAGDRQRKGEEEEDYQRRMEIRQRLLDLGYHIVKEETFTFDPASTEND